MQAEDQEEAKPALFRPDRNHGKSYIVVLETASEKETQPGQCTLNFDN